MSIELDDRAKQSIGDHLAMLCGSDTIKASEILYAGRGEIHVHLSGTGEFDVSKTAFMHVRPARLGRRVAKQLAKYAEAGMIDRDKDCLEYFFRRAVDTVRSGLS